MKIFKQSPELLSWVNELKKKGKKIGFVPTMGALHEGHLSLINHSLLKGEICIVSIFINPTQFNNKADFVKYPRPVEEDIKLLEGVGCHCLYLPSEEDIYPSEINTTLTYEIGYLENILEGEHRPGHFKGVVQIVGILLQNVQPDFLYLGAKDYQQCMVIQELVLREKIPVTIEKLPIKRESSGLAMSSRNMRLSTESLVKAPLIYKALARLKLNLKAGNINELKKEEEHFLNQNGFRTDYVEIADATTLRLVSNWDGEQSLVALVAANLGDVRLIDNLVLS